MSEISKTKIEMTLKRIQGQVGGIGKMIKEGKDCEAILTQVSAAMNSLKSVGRTLLSEEIAKCPKEDCDKLLKRFL